MKKDNINIPLFDYSTKMLIEILDKSNINEKEKEYRKKELLDIYTGCLMIMSYITNIMILLTK